MFNSQGKHAKAANVTSAAVDSGDSEDQLSHNSRKRQHKIDIQAAEIATVKAELNKALEENKKLKNLVSPQNMVEAMTYAAQTKPFPKVQTQCRKQKELRNTIQTQTAIQTLTIQISQWSIINDLIQ